MIKEEVGPLTRLQSLQAWIEEHPKLVAGFLASGLSIGVIYLLLKWINQPNFQRHPYSPEEESSIQKLYRNRSLVRKIANFWWIPRMNTRFSWGGFRPNMSLESSRNFYSNIRPWNYAEMDKDPTGDRARDKSVEEEEEDEQIPDELIMVLHCMRVIGFFDKNALLEIWKSAERIHIERGKFLFRVGDPDDQIYIVIRGSVGILLNDEGGAGAIIKIVTKGEHIFSLLSFLEVLTENGKPFRTIEARALEDSEIIRIPGVAFKDYWSRRPEILKISILKILRRIYGVGFIALHKVLGLGQELFVQNTSKKEEFKVTMQDISPELKNDVIESFMSTLGVGKDDLKFFEDCQVRIVEPEENVFFKGKATNKIFYIYAGELVTYFPRENELEKEWEGDLAMDFHGAGNIVGAMTFLCDEVYIFSCKASRRTILLTMDGPDLKGLLNKRPNLLRNLAGIIAKRISVLARQLSFGMEWMYLGSGKTLYSMGEAPDATYIVLMGRLRALNTFSKPQDNMTYVEYGNFDWIGLIDLITKQKRPSTVISVRDTQFAKIPNSLVEFLKSRFSVVSIRLLDFLGQHAAKTYKTSVDLQRSLQSESMHIMELVDNYPRACSAISIIPINETVPVTRFIDELVRHYHPYGSVFVLTLEKAMQKIGNASENFIKEFEGFFSSWSARLEEKYSLVIYLGTPNVSKWNLKIMRQSDTIFVLACFSGSKTVTEMEKVMASHVPRARKELVLIHKKIQISSKWTYKFLPKNTKSWLLTRNWLGFHHHIRMEYDPEPEIDQNAQSIDPHNDFSRLARWISRNSTGLVLGGGGAKGAAHIGFLEVLLNEKKVPIDMVCGVSIGAFIAGFIALYGTNFEMVESETKSWFGKMKQWWRYILDATLPYTSIFKGESFNTTLRESFEEIQIEDLWIPYFCVTTNLQTRHWRIHRFGTLWRYTRASMTLAPYFPPICDPEDGHYLMDGGYSNIVPADIMRQFGAQFIIAIDIGTTHFPVPTMRTPDADINELIQNFPFLPMGCARVPSIFETHSKLSFIQSSLHLLLMKKYDTATIFLRPNINAFQSKDFHLYDQIRAEGYKVGKELLKGTEPGDPVALTWIKLKKFNLK